MLKMIGIVLVLCGAGGFGIGKALQFYRQMQQLREFQGALEILKCDLNYTLMPLPKLCAETARRLRGACAQFFLCYAKKLEENLPRHLAAAQSLEETRKLCLPDDAQMAILELFSELGRFDLEGENRLLQLTAHRLNAALERCESEKKPLAKGYATLGICTGIALVILMV